MNFLLTINSLVRQVLKNSLKNTIIPLLTRKLTLALGYAKIIVTMRRADADCRIGDLTQVWKI